MKDTWDGEQDPLAALREGRPGPFEAFVSDEARAFIAFFDRLGATRSESEDLAQDTFLKLFRSATAPTATGSTASGPAGKGPASVISMSSGTSGGAESAAGSSAGPRGGYVAQGQFLAFAFRVARNVWIDRNRRRGSAVDAATGEGATEEMLTIRDETVETPEHALARSEESARVQAAVALLPESHRVVFEMAIVDEVPYAAISAALDVPVGTVKSRMHNAVRKVRATLEEADRVRLALGERSGRESSPDALGEER